jgi:RNA polymerase sigma-70 factor, ECF subfamily
MAIANQPEIWGAFDDDLLVAEVDECIRQAQRGCSHSLGHLYKQCHRYLLLIANRELDVQLRAKLGPSDVVQETMLKAQRSFEGFAGSTDGELRAWLRKILLNTVRDMARRYKSGSKRDVHRERELYSLLADQPDSPAMLRAETPSQVLMAAEHAHALRMAVQQMPADYRQVILLRNIERLPFNEIGEVMQRSGEASRKLWLRAIDRLRELLGASNERT